MDVATFEKGADLSEKRLAQMERKFSKLGDKISGLGKTLSLGITLPLTAFGIASANAASDAAELQSAFDQTFGAMRSEEHTSELQSLMRISYAVFCLKKKKT